MKIMNIAQNLKKLMDNRGLSNSRLAREIHVHTSTISNWLEGKEVKAENLTALCEYFGCSLDYLAGTTTEKAPTQEGERPKSKLRSIARLEDSKITQNRMNRLQIILIFCFLKKRIYEFKNY